MPHLLQNRKSTGKTKEQVRPVQSGMAWYTPENYKLLLRLSVDTSARHPTYKGWLDSALQAINNIRALGLAMVKVQVDVHELAEWCQEEGIPINQQACSSFVRAKLASGKATILTEYTKS